MLTLLVRIRNSKPLCPEMLSSFASRRFPPSIFSFSDVFLPAAAILFSTKTTNPISEFGFNFNTPEDRPTQTNFDPPTVREALDSYCNDWRRSYEFFNWVESECKFDHTTETYNRMLDILGKFFEFDLSWELIQRMLQSPFASPDHATFRIMFKRYASAHLVSEAIAAYERLREFKLRDETSFCNLIDSLCEYRHVVEAQDLCFGKNRKLNCDASTKIHNLILRGWLKMGWWSKCREFWEEMDKKGVRKDLHSYSIYMDIQCKSGKPWKAVKLYKEMKKKGMKLDVVAYNTVIHAIGISEGVDFASRVFHEMKEMGCKPNVVTCNTIIKLFCENGRFKDAHMMLDQMLKKDCLPNVITYHCFFRSLEKPKEILMLFDRMIKYGVQPKMDTYVMLMRKFGRWGFLRPVFVVWNKMEELGCSPDESAYNSLIDALVEKGMIDMARKYDEEMVAKGLSPKLRAELGTKMVNGGYHANVNCNK
ncbi:pentatricopeptide repeat-containing protein At1g80550, mitochondrial [Cucurbita moschata]|uniref:Pentatricopeptide repeat-containing protein At1g80550, mitochondrial n=1 Tax=Cucurbita moschata TaxID=3662 RepID=A0A6J1GNU3_CUCMO|nr:pentatricopeptide repeat-containing protein At1g80550, mitochondrial [Cucurbita moschata]XP_022953158.1 pentatricopeptide repeat-containing protein At1g80550, mitochondrial [Cucurbita moschata]XP_022953159.1 pentatricopeptide repeat-containing protein At1g80550, mitochondrial [Cucurbita moschata]